MDPTHANWLHHTCEYMPVMAALTLWWRVEPAQVHVHRHTRVLRVGWDVLRVCVCVYMCFTATHQLSPHCHTCMCAGMFDNRRRADTRMHGAVTHPGTDAAGCAACADVACSGGFPMSDALPMPGTFVSPNTITLKEGYTWEVRQSGLAGVCAYALRAEDRHNPQRHKPKQHASSSRVQRPSSLADNRGVCCTESAAMCTSVNLACIKLPAQH